MQNETAGKQTGRARMIAAGMVGNVIEWYDFALYGFMAVIISELFFPHGDKTVSLLATYGVFAAGFFMRPLGAIFFGHLGDTIGRKPVLLLSVVLMVLPTIALGIMPTYQDWGVVASILLVVIRLVQGFSVGGEFSSSATFMVETAPQERRGLAGSWANCGAIGGTLLGAGMPATVIWLLGEPAVYDWGWRIPFLLGGIIGVTGLALRRGLPEEEVPEEEREKGDHPIKRVFREEPWVLARVFVFTSAYGIVYYIPMVYLPTWQSLYSGVDLHQALFISTLVMGLQMVLIPLAGHFTDWGMRRTHFLAVIFVTIGLVAIPLYMLAETGIIWLVILVYMAFAALIAGPLGAVPTTLVEAFDRGHRLTGYSLSFNLGFGIFGGTAPMVATALIASSGSHYAPAAYLLFAGLAGAVALFFMRDHSRKPLR